MKYKMLLCALAAAVLGACSSNAKVSITEHQANELKDIRRICIISNTKRTPYGLDKVIARSLHNQGIDTEMVDTANRRRLYEPECRYNLRYVSAGNPQTIKKITAILRTPDYHVATVGYHIDSEPQYRSSPDLQRQTDGIIARLLGKKAQ